MRRKNDKLAVAAISISLLVAAVNAILGLPTLLDVSRLAKENRELSERIVAEGRERRDQSCLQDERAHLEDVRQLRRTYRFLLEYPNSELAQVVVRQLPQVERDARIDRAPKFCDEPGIGLPEPDPVIPKRPTQLNRP